MSADFATPASKPRERLSEASASLMESHRRAIAEEILVAIGREIPAYTRPLEVRTGINRKRQINLFDPDGTRIELMEPNTIDGQPAPSSTLPPPR